MLSILLSYLKNVEYQQWLSLVHCQLLYEAILAEWDGSQSRESSAAVCTTTPVTARLSRSLDFSSPWCCWWWWWWWWCSRLNGHSWSLGVWMSALSSSARCCPWACWQPAVEGVSNRGTGKRQQQQQQPRDQSELGECPHFSGQSGRRVVKERREEGGGGLWVEGRSGRCCRQLCVLWVVFTVSVRGCKLNVSRYSTDKDATCHLLVWMSLWSGAELKFENIDFCEMSGSTILSQKITTRLFSLRSSFCNHSDTLTNTKSPVWYARRMHQWTSTRGSVRAYTSAYVYVCVSEEERWKQERELASR